MAHDPSVSTSSAQTAKDRLMNLKKNERILHDPSGEQPDQVIKVAEPEVASSVEATLAQRGSRYGDFTDHAGLAQGLMFRLQTFNKPDAEMVEGFRVPWRHDLNDVQRQAITVIMDKIARILSGDPNYDDNWHDIQGYAKLVEDRLPCNQKKEI